MGPVTVVDLADFLHGVWRIDREVHDADRRSAGHFSGWGSFEADAGVPGLLRYVEHGMVQLGAHRGRAFRRLGYHVDGPCARVVFDDGRFFHDLDLRDGVCEVEHPCRADLYRGRFEVEHAGRWRQEWRVTGPHKDQLIRTTLERPEPLDARCVGRTMLLTSDPSVRDGMPGFSVCRRGAG